VKDRGRAIKNIIERYNKFVKPSFDEFIKPQKRFADIIVPNGSSNKIAIDLICLNLKKQLEIKSRYLQMDSNQNMNIKSIENSKKYVFLMTDIFDSKSISTEKVVLITDPNNQKNLKVVLEDFINQTRPEYLKLFANTYIQLLIDLFTDTIELSNCYIVDTSHEINQNILKNSKNVIFFKNCLISEEDIQESKEILLKLTSHKTFVLSIFLNPSVVKSLLQINPNLVFFTIYHSELLNNSNRSIILCNESDEYSYNSGFMSNDYLNKLFRKLIFNFFDDM